jgi:hypothetical protein
MFYGVDIAIFSFQSAHTRIWFVSTRVDPSVSFAENEKGREPFGARPRGIPNWDVV